MSKSSLAAKRTARSMRTDLAVTHLGVADQAQGSLVDVADAVGPVVNREVDIVIQRVDWVVATQRVFDGAPDIVAQQQSIVGLLGQRIVVIVAGSARNVVTSMISRPKRTCTMRRRPMMRELRNRVRTSGVASVAMSKSLGTLPSSESRT